MKTREQQLDLRKRRLRLTNHLFLLTAALFVIHQNTIRPAPALVEVPLISQAVQYQPQTPPPGFDPEQMTQDEFDLSIRPEERLYSPRVERAPITRYRD